MKLFKKPIIQRYRVLISSGIALVVLGIGFWLALILLSPSQRIVAGAYQVVYLTNGQAYFGKLQNTSGEYLVMKQPYTAQAVQPSADKPDEQPTTTLLKVRDQVYGPDDSIAIRASSVAFWQNLRDDSKITTTIKAKQ